MAGIIKSVDRFGRIALPKGLLAAIGVTKGDGEPLELFTGYDETGCACLFVRRQQIKCVVCDSVLQAGNHRNVRGKPVCFHCVNIMRER